MNKQNNSSTKNEQQSVRMPSSTVKRPMQNSMHSPDTPKNSRLIWIRNLFAGDPAQFYGLAFPSEKLKKDSRSTYWVATIANAINVLTSTPAIFFGFSNLGVLGPVLTAAISVGILKVSNESTSAAAASAKGNRLWSSQGLIVFIGLNVLLSAISGIGSELIVNRSGLRHKLAAEQLDKTLVVGSSLSQYEAQIAECNTLKETIRGLKKGDPVRDAAYFDAYGSVESQSSTDLLSIPDSALSVCNLVKKKTTEHNAEIEKVQAQASARTQLGNDLRFLKEQFPEAYDAHFTEDGTISSGTEEFRLAFDSFFGNLLTEDYSNLGKMGFSFFMFSLSVITSAGACSLVVGHVLRKDTVRSHDPRIKAAITAHRSYIERAITNDRTSIHRSGLNSNARSNVVNLSNAAPPSNSKDTSTKADSSAERNASQSSAQVQKSSGKRRYRRM